MEENSMDKKMKAKERSEIWIKSERDFFALIEKKMEQQGYEVLETLTAHPGKGTKEPLAHKFTNRFAY
jgi:hypothetical protein